MKPILTAAMTAMNPCPHRSRAGALLVRVIRIALLAVVMASATACGEPLEFPDWTIPVPEGTRVVEYAAVPLDAREQEIEMVEDLVIGGDTSDPEVLFHPRGYTEDAIAVDEQHIFVLDSGNARVQAFDLDDGSYRFTIGGEGQGPGEFERAGRIAIAGGRLVVVDTGAPKLSFWSLQGEHIEDTSTRAVRLARHFAGLNDGTMVLRFQERQGDESVIVLARIDGEGGELRRYLEAPAPRVDVLEIDGRFVTVSHSGPEATFAVADRDHVYATAASEYQVLAFDAEGNASWALRVAMRAEPYPQDSIAGAVENVRRIAPSVTADMLNWPEWLPVLSYLLVDGHGHLYVFPHVRGDYIESEGRRPVDVYGPDGERLFSGFARTRWEAAEGDFVYAYEESGADGEWRVVRYRLVEPFR